MLRRPINHHDYDGNPTTTIAYFHLNKFEWLELETYTKGGLIQNLESALETNNAKKTIDLLKKIILRAYGERIPRPVPSRRMTIARFVSARPKPLVNSFTSLLTMRINLRSSSLL